MSKKQSKIEIYSLEDFKKSDRIGRIRMHMLEPERFVLNDLEETYYRHLQQAYHLVFGELQESVAIRAIQEAIPGAESWYLANRILRDIYELFSPFLQKNRELRRAILVEKLYEMAKAAEKHAYGKRPNGQEYADPEWMAIAERLYTQAGKFEGLDQHEAPMLDPDEVQIPHIEITADPAAFLAAQAEDSGEEAEEWDDDE